MNNDVNMDQFGESTSTKLAIPLQRLWNPLKHFILTDTSSGLVLLISTIVALLWANLSTESYSSFWGTHAAISLNGHTLELTLREWVNDGLMTIFFLSVGMGIKREMMVGELSSFRQAVLPIIAAGGGMLVPALIFTAIAGGTEYSRGWGIPVATDIAFALGVLTLVGKRVPASLKVFLVALAIADDLGAVLVIALFYSTTLNLTYLGAAFAIFAMLIVSNRLGVRTLLWYCTWGVGLWLCVLNSGVHSTIAGVMLAITIPAWSRLDLPRFSKTVNTVAAYLKTKRQSPQNVLSDHKIMSAISQLNMATLRIQPSLFTLETALANWVAMVIMPLFALSNAGVVINNVDPNFLSDPLVQGIATGLIIGKPIGIVCGTWLTIKLGFASMPRLASWAQMWGVGIIGGVGFTMSLFVSGLALVQGSHLNTACLAILCASATAGTIGFTLLRLLPSRTNPNLVLVTEDADSDFSDEKPVVEQ